MKKYNTPEIETLALETIDVIATSGDRAAESKLDNSFKTNGVTELGDISNFDTKWSW